MRSDTARVVTMKRRLERVLGMMMVMETVQLGTAIPVTFIQKFLDLRITAFAFLFLFVSDSIQSVIHRLAMRGLGPFRVLHVDSSQPDSCR